MAKKDILLVDDDPDIRDSLRIVLEKEGYTVRTASNGTRAREELEKQRPDLLILDIMMATDTEGFDLAFAMRERPEFEGMPIVLLTSFLDKVREDGPDQFQHILGEEWPAKWLFEKPVDTKRLLNKISGILAGE
jgi:two-component system alkaline phosphatase synthesis response regulator PhoP